jgi:hypothetical protein
MRQYTAERCRFRRSITISSPVHPFNRRRSLADRCLSVTPIVTFRFWEFRNGDRDPAYGAIIFRMQDLNAVTHRMFGSELESIVDQP